MNSSAESEPLPDDWWTAEDCARFLGITRSTWAAYVARQQAPQPERRFGRSPVWPPVTVKAWAQARPRRPSDTAR